MPAGSLFNATIETPLACFPVRTPARRPVRELGIPAGESAGQCCAEDAGGNIKDCH